MNTFTQNDFEIFNIDGLKPRMRAIEDQLQPKFAEIGAEIADFLTDELSEPMYVHIARHLRRTVHPPEKTWVAVGPQKRGYKPYPHFQLAIDDQQLSIWFAVFSECKHKQEFAQDFLTQLDQLWPQLPAEFVFSGDHTRDESISLTNLTQTGMAKQLDRVKQVKKAEFLCGTIHPQSNNPQTGSQLLQLLKQTYKPLIPLYQVATKGHAFTN